MNSFERTMAAISHQEPDRVPLFLLLSLYGAKELQIPVKEYFSKSENVVRAQLGMKEKYRNDCLFTFSYAAAEIEAFGGEVIFVDEGPPNSGQPFIKSVNQIASIKIPDIGESTCLRRVLDTTELLKKEAGNETPVIGVVVSPFSLPVMQMGFEKYLEMMYFQKDAFDQLMQINEEFCVAWANAQLAAGATAIGYFDPLASPNIIERPMYLATGHKVAMRTLARIKGPTTTHLASGIALPVIDDIIQTGSAVLGFSDDDDLVAIKKAARNRICLLGNLNGIEMIHWDSSKIESKIQHLLSKAAPGGGFILSDNHGEIPWQVPEEVLLGISDAVSRFGTYPILTE